MAGEAEQVTAVMDELVDIHALEQREGTLFGADEVQQDERDQAAENGPRDDIGEGDGRRIAAAGSVNRLRSHGAFQSLAVQSYAKGWSATRDADVKLVLLCQGATESMRRGGFPAADEAVEGRATLDVGFDTVATSPYRAARQTAAMLHPAPEVVEALRDIDHGSWAGRSFAEVHADAPDAFAGWLARPWTGTPDGEEFASVCARVGDWIGNLDDAELPQVLVTHPMVIRAILAVTIGIADEAVMRIDIPPLSTAVLSRHRGWRLQRLGGRLSD